MRQKIRSAGKTAVRSTAGRLLRIDQLEEELARRGQRLKAAEAEVRRLTKERDRDQDGPALRAQLAKAERSRADLTQRATQLGYGYRALRAAALGAATPGELGHAPGRRPEGDERIAHEEELRSVQRRSVFAQELAAGRGLESAIARLVRSARGTSDTTDARRIAQWLYDQPGTRQAGVLGTALVAHAMGLPRFAWERMSQLPDEVWLEHAPSEYAVLSGEFDPEACRAALRRVLDADPDVGSRAWLDLTRRAMGLDLGATCTELAARFDAAAARELASGTLEPEAADQLEVDRAWTARWAPRVAAGEPDPLPTEPGVIPFAVLGYDQPDRRNTSSNIGDYVQTIGSLAHLVRHTGVEFDGGVLGRFATDLAARVPQDLRVDSGAARVALHQVDRDASSYSAVPDGTWMLAFGWYAHKIGGVRHDFPFPSRLRPLYVSFHVNKRAILTDEAVEHLRAHGPIGCRDWSTVDLLLGLDVPAFFSGCLTTTVRYVRPDDTPEPPEDAPTLYVDTPAPKGETRLRNERPEVVLQDVDTNLREALASLDTYASGVSRVVTKRLHAYLPARALGRPVDFVPRNPADIRFAGLSPLTDEEVHDMGAGIADLLEPVVGAILAGREEADVRAEWTRVTADRVAAARARHEAQVPLPALVDVPQTVATIAAGRTEVPRTEPGPDGPEMHVVLALDGNLKEQFLVVVDALVEHASRPVHLVVLCRDHDPDDYARVAALFPTVHVTWYPCDEITYGDIHAMIPHITVSTMDRLVLPELLTDVDRVVYHDIDALPTSDVAELYETDLGGLPLAARDSEASTMQSGYSNIYHPASMPDVPPGNGSELIRRETARHPYDFTGFNAGIMVLDLARMRADRFCERFLPYASSFGMHDQHILNVYVGAGRVALDPAWNARPTQESVRDPKIVHWAGGQKPWQEGYVSHQDLWQAQEERVRTREATLRDR